MDTPRVVVRTRRSGRPDGAGRRCRTCRAQRPEAWFASDRGATEACRWCRERTQSRRRDTLSKKRGRAPQCRVAELDDDVLLAVLRRAATLRARCLWLVVRLVCTKMERVSFAHFQETLGLPADRRDVVWFASGLHNYASRRPLLLGVPPSCVHPEHSTLEADHIREAIRLYRTRDHMRRVRAVHSDAELESEVLRRVMRFVRSCELSGATLAQYVQD
jgi:hypothetical protein